MSKREDIPAPTDEDLQLDLSAVLARAEAARPKDLMYAGMEAKWDKPLDATPEHNDANGVYHLAGIWYPDGDQCAAVHGNLGYDVDGDAVARFLAAAWADVPALVRRLAAAETEAARLRRDVEYRKKCPLACAAAHPYESGYHCDATKPCPACQLRAYVNQLEEELDSLKEREADGPDWQP